MKRCREVILQSFVLFFCLSSASVMSEETDEQVPRYERKPGVAGKITSVGSDTLANLMTFWSQEFRELYPQVKFQIQASGSSTAPPALTEGTATLGPMSRELKPSERRDFIRAHGYPPLVLRVAMDAIAIFVERRNSLEGLTLQQVDAIFSATQFCGAPAPVTHWHQLGLRGPDACGVRSPIRRRRGHWIPPLCRVGCGRAAVLA